MVRLYFLRRRLVTRSRFAPLRRVTIRLVLTGLIFGGRSLLFGGLGAGTFGSPVAAIALFPEAPLSFGRTLAIKMSRLAVCAVVNLGHRATVVIALNVLPGFTPFTEHGITVIIFKRADAFDGVRLVVFR
jgi:hypothetical protein